MVLLVVLVKLSRKRERTFYSSFSFRSNDKDDSSEKTVQKFTKAPRSKFQAYATSNIGDSERSADASLFIHAAL